jgi:hypothetical protein
MTEVRKKEKRRRMRVSAFAVGRWSRREGEREEEDSPVLASRTLDQHNTSLVALFAEFVRRTMAAGFDGASERQRSGAEQREYRARLDEYRFAHR